MLQLIKKPRLLHTSTGQPRTIGDVNGVSDEVAATCLARMQNWWTLARAVLSAEFPDFDVVRRFSAFDLPRVEGGGLAHLRLVPRDALVRVANFLALNPEGLVAEFRDLRVVAERVRRPRLAQTPPIGRLRFTTHKQVPSGELATKCATCCPLCGGTWSNPILPPAWSNASPNVNSSWGSAETSGSGPSNGSWCCPLPHDTTRKTRNCAAPPV